MEAPRPADIALPNDVEIRDFTAEALGLPVAVRTYGATAVDAPLPIVVFMHGGGFVNGGLDSMQFFCGDSAGGNLAAALCLRARRDGFTLIRKQILVYPTLDATQSSPRLMHESEDRRRERFTYYGYYAAGTESTDELVSPLLADSVDGLPDAVILTAEADALRDDGILYANRLRAAGVPVRLTNYLGMPHGFLSMPRLCRTAASQAILEIADALVWPRAPGLTGRRDCCRADRVVSA
jgi:acetyl esterase/lipase